MAKKAKKKSPKRKAKKADAPAGQVFSLVSLHNKLDETVARLQDRPRTAKRDELIALIKGLRADTPCPPQIMLVDLGV